MVTFSWKDEPELMARLIEAQNHPANLMIDIMTFAGFCASRDMLNTHVIRYEQKVAAWTPKRRRAA